MSPCKLPSAVFSPQAAADYLGVDRKTLYREIQRGRLRCFHVGAQIRITEEQLIEYMEES